MPTELLRNWAAGVVTSMQSDELPAEASPRARNNALYQVLGGYASAGQRRGAPLRNPIAISGATAIIGQYAFKRRSGQTLTQHHLLVSANGRLDTLESDDTTNPADSGTTTPFTVADRPRFASANNLAFIVNGTDKKKFDGTDVWNFGITRPSAPTVVDSGVAGNPSGTYEFALSYGNTATGAESSRSDATSVTVTSKKITVSFSAPADPQIDIVYLHVRKGTLTSTFFRLITGTTPASSSGGFSPSVGSITVDCTDAQLNALITLSPATDSADPPPSGITDIAWHRNRMFAIDATNLYYSNNGKPEAFAAASYEPVAADDGQKNVAIIAAFDRLFVFKSNSIYYLEGNGPEEWQLVLAEPNIGCASRDSLVYANGFLWWWSEERGPMRWNGSGSPDAFGEALIAPTIAPESLDFDYLSGIVAAADMPRQRILFAVPRNDGGGRNNIILPFSYRIGAWESDAWELVDVASFGIADDANGQPWVYIGGYGGRVSQLYAGDVDGIRLLDGSGNPLTFAGNVTAYTASTVTDSGATFDTTGDGLKEAYVTVFDEDGNYERRRISSNTGTVLTLSNDITLVPVTYTIGAANWELDTKWLDAQAPFSRKHLQFLFAQATSPTGAAEVGIKLFLDWNLTDVAKEFTIDAAGGGAMWGTATWDISTFADSNTVSEVRRRVAKKAKVYRVRFTHYVPNVACIVLKLALDSTLMGKKR